MTQEARHAQVLALLRREGTVRIATLAKAFDVTTETARRDLDELAQGGALTRTYGGGASRSLTEEPGIGERSRAHAAERSRIGTTAAAMVDEGDAVMIDCGSTTTLFANALAARDLHLTVVTNCLPAARVLGTSAHCRVILCPGDYVMREGGVYGSETVDFVRRFKANKAFIGAGGITSDGVTDADSLSCAVKRAMMERSDRDGAARRQFEIRARAVRAGMRARRRRRPRQRRSAAETARSRPEARRRACDRGQQLSGDGAGPGVAARWPAALRGTHTQLLGQRR